MVLVRSDKPTHEHMQNMQEPLDGHFRAVENQGKWIKKQGKIREIDLSLLADTLFLWITIKLT